jgi:hypothetical protein
MNVEKEFVPYQQSLQLKEIGFDEPCFTWYWDDIGLYNGLEFGNHNKNINYVSAPTFSQAFRWFREKYNIDAWVQPFALENKDGVLYLPDESYSYFIFKDGMFVDDKVDFLEPEEAELECLKKLIEIIKNK